MLVVDVSQTPFLNSSDLGMNPGDNKKKAWLSALS
jgi:hypothetical protein